MCASLSLERQTEGSGFQGYKLSLEFQASLGYVRPLLKAKAKTNQTKEQDQKDVPGG